MNHVLQMPRIIDSTNSNRRRSTIKIVGWQFFVVAQYFEPTILLYQRTGRHFYYYRETNRLVCSTKLFLQKSFLCVACPRYCEQSLSLPFHKLPLQRQCSLLCGFRCVGTCVTTKRKCHIRRVLDGSRCGEQLRKWNNDAVDMNLIERLEKCYCDKFNYFHSLHRINIEQAFDLLLQRWGIFWRPVKYYVADNLLILSAALRLHNFATD